MTFDEFLDFPKKPGIYYFRNTVNGKYYIGQAQEIRDRLRKHKTNFISNYFSDAHIYRAWRKYGIEVFEVGVLEIVDLPKGDKRNNKLDELEVKYVKEYDSYGTGGYNQTFGGDGGIKGYKFTENQKERARINSLKTALDGRYRIYFYDTLKNQYGSAPSFNIILQALNRVNCSRFYEKQICYYGRYIFSHSLENIENKKNIFYSPDYEYVLEDEYDNITDNLQELIDTIVSKYQKEIDDFFSVYGYAKYNRKDNKSKKDAIRVLQKEDLMNGISKEEYKEKYNILSDSTFYQHVKKLYPEWCSTENATKLKKITPKGVCYFIPSDHMTDDMKQDIINGMRCGEFIKKYNVSESSFNRYKHKIEKELNIKIVSNPYIRPVLTFTEEQERDILSGIDTIEYMRKYNVTETTYYEHRRIYEKKHPEQKIKRVNTYKPKVDIDLIRDDILNGISKRDFCLKYSLSESCYKKYKRIILNEDVPIHSNITEEMKIDIKQGMNVSEYMKKYKVSKDTFYNHRRLILNSKK